MTIHKSLLASDVQLLIVWYKIGGANANFEYSYDLQNWYTLNGSESGTTNTFDAIKHTVYLRGNNPNGLGQSSTKYNKLLIKHSALLTDNIGLIIYGRLLDLLDNGTGTITDISSLNYCFYSLFKNSWFVDATLLNLNIPNLSQSCFRNMFYNCTNLTSAPGLPATTLTEACYAYMFQCCTNLTKVHALPASTLVEACYLQMFMECSNLSRVVCLCTTSVDPTATLNWLQWVAPVGTFIKAEGVNWSIGETGIPEGWSVRNYRYQNNLCAGNDKVNNIILGGDTQIKKVYLGNTLLWEIGMLYVKSGVTTIPISCGNMTFKEYTTYDFGNGAEQAIHLQKTERHSGSTNQGGWSVTFNYDAYVKRHISISQMIANTSYSLKGTKNSLEYTYSWSDADYNNYFEIR